MIFDTARRINSAASFIGLALLGVVEEVGLEHVRTIRAVSLAQMQTAKEVIEAHNAAGIAAGKLGTVSTARIHCVCEERLLVNVKAYADAAQV